LDHQYDERDHEQDVNKSAQGVRGNNSEQPQHEKNYKDCPKHFTPPDDSFTSTITQPLTPRYVCGLFAPRLTALINELDTNADRHQRRCATAEPATASRTARANLHCVSLSSERTGSRGQGIRHHRRRFVRARIKHCSGSKESEMLLAILLIVLIFGFGYGGYRMGPGWGYYGGGGLSLILTIVLILILLRVI
jgi:hypothetical protein